jgi:hypothetical protein
MLSPFLPTRNAKSQLFDVAPALKASAGLMLDEPIFSEDTDLIILLIGIFLVGMLVGYALRYWQSKLRKRRKRQTINHKMPTKRDQDS